MRRNYDEPESVYPPLEAPNSGEETDKEEREFVDDFGQYPGDYDFYSSKNRYRRIRETIRQSRRMDERE